MSPQKIVILGGTGSIGSQTLEILRLFPESFRLQGVSFCGNNPEKIEAILTEFAPEITHVFDEMVAAVLRKKWPACEILSDTQGATLLLERSTDAILLNALPGESGLTSSRFAVAHGQMLLLANKESLVLAGKELVQNAQKTGAQIIPIDSELSALWQLLSGRDQSTIEKIYLPCSGGPFWDAALWPVEKMAAITRSEALRHPTWNMGKKISIDSATLMNKAFELIACVRLFGVSVEKVEVVIHPECILHAAVKFRDGQVLALMGPPDMRQTIASVLCTTKDLHNLPFSQFNFFDQKLRFFPPDEIRFPSLYWARQALQAGEEKCAQFCRTNDAAVADFLSGKINFSEIFMRVRTCFPEE